MPKTDTNFSTYTTIMRVTTQGRPYTKDLYDMFAAVLLQITLTDHRVMFRTYAYTFTTEEAAKVMASLVFTHIQRKPDPLDPSRQIATRTTTTFSMDHTAAKTLLQQFLLAGLIMNATDPTNIIVRDKGIFSPTLKGKYVLEEFADSTQISMSTSLITALNAPHMSASTSGSTGNRVIVLDRMHDDQITFSRPNITAVFKSMAASLPREALIPDIFGGIETRHVEIYQYTFLGQQCMEWLCERLTVNSREEAEAVAAEFVLFGWLAQILDRSDRSHSTKEHGFNASRNSIYYVTDRGCAVIGWKTSDSAGDSVHSDSSIVASTSTTSTSTTTTNKPRLDSTADKKPRPPSMAIADSAPVSATRARLTQILESPLMRMYFRDFLRANYCVENINFWVDYHKLSKNKLNKPTMEQLADAYLIYDTYLGPTSECNLNIDHTLHHEIVSYVNHVFQTTTTTAATSTSTNTHVFVLHAVTTTAVSSKNNATLLTQPSTKQTVMSLRNGITPDSCLTKMMSCFAKVNEHVCLMMAEDSVPKFIKTKRFKELFERLELQKQQGSNNNEEEDEGQDYEYEDSSDEEEDRNATTRLKNSFSDQRSIMVKHTALAL